MTPESHHSTVERRALGLGGGSLRPRVYNRARLPGSQHLDTHPYLGHQAGKGHWDPQVGVEAAPGGGCHFLAWEVPVPLDGSGTSYPEPPIQGNTSSQEGRLGQDLLIRPTGRHHRTQMAPEQELVSQPSDEDTEAQGAPSYGSSLLPGKN